MISDANCKDQNLVYVLLCKNCEKTVYVGEAERTLKERIDEHMHGIKYQKEKNDNETFYEPRSTRFWGCGSCEDDWSE